ncbi:MAG: DUF4876 domain-containing protein [Clostridium sp.]|nr:DUF4876 domain-containing protein [Clostridium sp.]
MKKIFTKLLLVTTLIAGFTACSSDDNPAPVPQTVSVSITNPSDIDASKIVSESLTFHNVNTLVDTTFANLNNISVLPGLYDIAYDASVELSNGALSHLRANLTSVQINEGVNRIELTTYNNITTDDLIIAEVFFTGTLNESGDQYSGDKYVKLYNNTDHVLYADGITLFETEFLTTDKLDCRPDIMDQAVAVHALYSVPGNGTEHPVQPGEYFLLVDNAQNHTLDNPWSFDLTKADFEWYDETSNPRFPDVDNSAVPNMTKIYCYTATTFSLHNRGFRAFGIARLGVPVDEYIKNYVYEYEYDMILSVGTFTIDGDCYRLPNEWVVDVVNCSVEAEYAWNVTSPRLDSGWAHCGSMDHDTNRYFKSVRRKLLYLEPDGRAVLKDTNNSTDDFNSDAIPSEAEIQGSVINANGDRATRRTYDGVTPIMD